jgi:hypothetical protein
MRWLLALACSCNQVLGVTGTHLPDASPPDAPFGCPPIGITPKFAPGLHQVVAGQCSGAYMTTTGGRAVAECYFPGMPLSPIGEGSADQLLSPAAGIMNTVLDIGGPRLTPEGDEMLVVAQRQTQVPPVAAPFLEMYRRGSDGTWTLEYAFGIPFSIGDAVGTFTAGGPIGRRLVIAAMIDSSLHEYVYDGTTWSAGWVQPMTDLGVASIVGISLTSDGRRMVFSTVPTPGATPLVYYSDRMDVGIAFRNADLLPGVPAITDPFLTDDCARVYYTAYDIEAVFYSQQL